MSITRIVPPIDYLRSASRPSLQSFELGRLNHAANLRREIAVLIDQWLEDTAEAMLARYMLEHHGSLREPALSVADLLRSFQEPGSDPLTQAPRVEHIFREPGSALRESKRIPRLVLCQQPRQLLAPANCLSAFAVSPFPPTRSATSWVTSCP